MSEETDVVRPRPDQEAPGSEPVLANGAAVIPAGLTDARSRDLRLLQAYEPTIRFTAGELFFPTAVETYVAHAALWEIEGSDRSIVPAREPTVERLVAESVARPGAELSMRFVDEPLGRRAHRA